MDDCADHGSGALISRCAGTGQENDCHVDAVTLLDSGPVFTTVRIKGRTEGIPEFARDIVLYHQTDRIDVSARLLRNSEPNLELYFAFPFKAESPEFHFEASGSVVEPLVDQLPGSNTDYYAIQNWVHVADGEQGIVWTPIDNHMAELGGLWPGCVSTARRGLTGPNYGHKYLGPGDLKTGHIYSLIMYSDYQTNFINVQPSEFMCRYSFRPVSGDWRGQEIRRHGWDTANPLLGVWMHGPQPGQWPQQNTFAAIDASNVVLLTIRPAEDGRGHIVRLIETAGQAGDVTVSLPGLKFSADVQTNLVEEDLAPAECSDGTVTFHAEPFRYHTVRLLDSE